MEKKRFRTSLAWRAATALALFVGYYVLAVVVAGFLLFIPYAEVRYTGSIHYVWLPVFCVGAAALILWSIVPRRARFEEPGPRLTPESDPRLFEELQRVARQWNQETPQEVYLLPDVTAWVGVRGGFLGLGSRRIAGVGLALLGALSVSEFRAVLAHEFAHFHRGDTRLGPWIHKTRSAIGRTLQGLHLQGRILSRYESVIRLPFVLYGNWFLRITQAISRRQESLADELSALTAGRETTVSALRKTYMAGLAFPLYWPNELMRVLSAGFLPPFAAGFGPFMESETVKGQLEKALGEIEKLQSQPYDEHPSLGERIRALEALPAGREPEEAPPAVSLLGNLQRRERELFALMNPELGPKLRPIGWEDVTAAVHIPYWAELTRKHQGDLAGVTPEIFPDKLPELAKWGERMAVTSGQVLTEDQAKSYATYVVAVATVTRMIQEGWQASRSVGQQVMLSRGEKSWRPFVSANALADGETTPSEWRALCDEMGIADLELGSRRPRVSRPAGVPVSKAEPAPEARGKIRNNKYAFAGLIGIVILGIVYFFQPGGPGGSGSGRSYSGSEYAFSIATDNSHPPSQRGGRRGVPTDRPSSGPGDSLSLAIEKPDLVARVTQRLSGTGGYGAAGEVINNGPKTFHFVMIRVEFLDKTGRVVGALMTDGRADEYVFPRGTKSFVVRGNGNLVYERARALVVYSVEVK